MNKHQRILFIVNPVSGIKKAQTQLFSIINRLQRFPDGTIDPDRLITVSLTAYRRHATELAARAADEEFDTVVACGGDGTLNEVINGLLTIPIERRPCLGYIPCGSTNDFAASLKLPLRPVTAAGIAVGNNDIPLDVGTFATDIDNVRETRRFSYIACFGAFTDASYGTAQTFKNVLGHFAYILQSFNSVWEIRDTSVKVYADGQLIADGKYIFAAVSNTTSAGGVVKYSKKLVSVNDGKLELMLIKRPDSPATLAAIASSLLNGNPEGNPSIIFSHAGRYEFFTEECIDWSLDGEMVHGGKSATILVEPSAIRLQAAGTPS